MDSSSRLGYMPALDGLRAVAIVLVVAYHAVPGFSFGLIGVDVFFVLSGFLITALIATSVQAGDFSRRRFYARRAIRLVPALVVTVLAFTPIGVLVMDGEPTWLGAGAALLYLTPFVPMTIFQHTWTLAVEEWFYLAWPVVLGKFFRDRLTLRQCAALVGGLGVVTQASMVLAPGSIAARPSALLIGCALSMWWLDGGRLARPASCAYVGLLAIVAGSLVVDGALPYWLAVGGAVLVVGGVASGASMRPLEMAPMVVVGIVSYEWYLLHAPMLKLAHELWGDGSYWVIAPASLVAALGLHYAIVPLQTRMRRRLDQIAVPAASRQTVPSDQPGLLNVVS